MALSSEQLKGRIKNLATKNNADARVLIRLYMMDRFLERLAISKYKNDFIIKGGLLITSMVGVSLRSTMDIDVSIKNYDLNEKQITDIINEIIIIKLDDNIRFELIRALEVMDEMEYPGIRLELNAYMENLVTPFKIDISTGDAITPNAIEYSYNLLMEEKKINLYAYNIETVLAEKMQTILARSIFNTRMRDFYDIYSLSIIYENKININVLQKAFNATCENRKTNNLLSNAIETIDAIKNDNDVLELWKKYQNKFSYASEISFDKTIERIVLLINLIK